MSFGKSVREAMARKGTKRLQNMQAKFYKLYI